MLSIDKYAYENRIVNWSPKLKAFLWLVGMVLAFQPIQWIKVIVLFTVAGITIYVTNVSFKRYISWFYAIIPFVVLSIIGIVVTISSQRSTLIGLIKLGNVYLGLAKVMMPKAGQVALQCIFFITFCSLRTQTNGFHAKSICICLLYSILGELFFLRILPSVWNDIIAFISLDTSIVLIWFLAPYNHPNMALSSEKVIACAKGRLNMLLITFIMLHVWKQNQLAQGILLGIIMAASTLTMAYCSKKAI